MADRGSSSQAAPRPVAAVNQAIERVPEALSRVPGAAVVRNATSNVLDAVGTVSPQARRAAVYAGAAALGVIGLIEWPVAAAVAGVAWLTQPRREGDSRERQPARAGRARQPARREAARSTRGGTARSSRGTTSRASARTSGRGGRTRRTSGGTTTTSS
ncbi:hypothetical protein [Gandjariella thermophila]|uniref:Uncharacterized protein n=1 Tax=Gandjariella thermophila TaxID=1931992 RepID=A0A4D4J353_9PSEU|nr:hypothetical protein [Gandjariella thermophila]GDY29059.1 hypothetical protein GTS_06920 [Gandjariella thermophila]